MRLFLRGDTWYTHVYVNGRHLQRTTRCQDRIAAEARAVAIEREVNGASGEQTEDEAHWFRGATSFIYFVQAEAGGPIKIGRAAAPQARLVRIQTGSAEKLRILCAIAGGPRLELALHAAFAKHRREGEWFAPVPALLKLVAELRCLAGKGVA